MKKSLLSILTLALVAVGCQNYDDQFDSLNTQITALTTKVDGLPPDTSAAITAINNAIKALETQVGTLGTSDLTAADLTLSLVDVLQQIADVKADLVELDTEVGTSIAGVVTQVTTLAAELSDVAAAQLTQAQVTAIVAVTDQTTALTAVQTSLDELLSAEASVNAQVNIRNQAELDYAKTIIQTDGSPESYIINGGLTVDATGTYTAGTDYTAEINALTSRITSVIGVVDITSATDVATGTIDITKLTYVSGTFTVAGHFNPNISVLTTAASVSVPLNSAYPNWTLTELRSAAGGLVLTDNTTTAGVSPTSVDVSACTNCGSVVTAGTTLDLRYAAVNLGSGLPAATTIVGSLISTSVAPYTGSITGIEDATTGATGDISINSLTVTVSTITGNNITLDNGAATSSFGKSTIRATGNIIVDAIFLNKASNGSLVITNTLSAKATSVGTISLGAKEIYEGTITAASTGTITASALTLNGTGALSFTANDVILTSLITNTAALTIVGDTNIQVPNLEASGGTITAATATVFYAPKLTTTDGIALNFEEGTAAVNGVDVTLKNLVGYTDATELPDIATLHSLTLTGQDASLDLSAAVAMTTLKYASSVTAGALIDNDLTLGPFSGSAIGSASLTTIDFTGNTAIDDLVIRAVGIEAVTLVGKIRTLTVTGSVVNPLSKGNKWPTTVDMSAVTGINGGAAGSISVVGTGVATLNITNWTFMSSIAVTANTSMTTFTFPSSVASATNTSALGIGTVTITNNAITGVFVPHQDATASSLFVECSITGVGFTNAKSWLTARIEQGGINPGTPKADGTCDGKGAIIGAGFALEIDADTADILTEGSVADVVGQQGVTQSAIFYDASTAANYGSPGRATSNIDTKLKLTLMPN